MHIYYIYKYIYIYIYIHSSPKRALERRMKKSYSSGSRETRGRCWNTVAIRGTKFV